MISVALGDGDTAIGTLEGLLDGGDEFAELEQARALLAELGK